MDLKRQLDYDRTRLEELNAEIFEWSEKFRNALNAVSELSERIANLREQRKDYEIRVIVREQQLAES